MKKALYINIILILSILLISPTLLLAKDGDDDKKESRTKLRTKLSAIANTDTLSKGKVRYRSRTRSDRTKVKFRIDIKVPVPSDFLPLNNEQDAESLDIRAHIARDGVVYAECTLPFFKIVEKPAGLFAEYKARLKKRSRDGRPDRFTSKKGAYCDTDLLTDGIQNNIPEVQKDDSITVLETDSSEFLEGTL